MARIVTGGLTTFNLSTHLDPQTLDLYGIANYFQTPAYTGTDWKVYVSASGEMVVGSTNIAQPNPGVSVLPIGQVLIGNNAQASGYSFMQFQRSTVVIGSITQSGTTAILYNTTSDRRLKKTIRAAKDCGDVIDAIKVRSFTWKGKSGETVTHGFIAQELAEVAPQAVKVGDSGPLTKDSDIWGVDPSKLMPLLVKELQSLRARVAALEGA